MNVKLLDDLLLIRRSDPVRQIGAIVLAESALEELQEGVVIAAGPGKRFERRVLPKLDGGLAMNETAHWIARPMSVAVGDRVLFSQHGHQRVKLDGEEYVTLHEESVVAVIQEPQPVEAPAPEQPMPEQEPVEEEDDTPILDESVLYER
jgi:chaperonin GroES